MRESWSKPSVVRKALFRSIPASALLAAYFTLFGPAQAIMANWHETSVGFHEFLSALLLPYFIGFLILVCVAVFLVPITRGKYLAFLIGISIIFWVQYEFFAWDYGKFDGSAIDWREYRNYGLLEVAFACSVLVLVLWKATYIIQHSLYITIGLLLLQTASVAASYIQHAPYPAKRDGGGKEQMVAPDASQAVVNVDAVTSFSPDSNVLIIVLDMFQSDFLAEILQDPRSRDSMPPGFTYYRNAVSLYPITKGSLQSILTSKSTTNLTVDYVPWQNRQMARSIPNLLAAVGFQSTLISSSAYLISCTFIIYDYICLSHNTFLDSAVIASGVKQSNSRPVLIRDVSAMLGVTWFRYSPHFLKSWMYNNGAWRLPRYYLREDPLSEYDSRIFHAARRDFGTLRILTQKLVADSEVPTFKFLHFYSPHLPHDVDRDCNYNGVPNDHSLPFRQEMVEARRDAVGQASCVFSKVVDLLWKLDSLGAYDPSLIFIVGDHGHPTVGLRLDLASSAISDANYDGQDQWENAKAQLPFQTSRSVPLFLVKRTNERAALRFSDIPVSLCDIPASIFSELSIEESFDCESIFAIEKDRETSRFNYQYPPATSSNKGPTSDLFIQYEVKGHSWLSDSWAATAE